MKRSRHTMEAHSLGRHWPVLVSRLAKAGLTVVERPGTPGLEPVDDGPHPGRDDDEAGS